MVINSITDNVSEIILFVMVFLLSNLIKMSFTMYAIIHYIFLFFTCLSLQEAIEIAIEKINGYI